MAKINKALDLNKLFTEHKKGKLLKKHPKFPMYVGLKYDGNYVAVIADGHGEPMFFTSGGHVYDNSEETIFHNAPTGYVYLAERIGTHGKLGDRVNCNLRGPRGQQTSYGHSYKVFDMIKINDYNRGLSGEAYMHRRTALAKAFDPEHIVEDYLVNSMAELEESLIKAVKAGYEGVVGKCPHWLWKSTKSRTVEMLKYKKRPTVDLLVVGVNEGTGKYKGLIGSLTLQDKAGRTVDVGSGISDEQRYLNPDYFMDCVVEMFYEQILDTYIQPTFGDEYEGVLIREDKTKADID